MMTRRGMDENHTENDGGERERVGIGLSLRVPKWLFVMLRDITSKLLWKFPHHKPMLSHGPMCLYVLAWFACQDQKQQILIVQRGMQEMEDRENDGDGGSHGPDDKGGSRGPKKPRPGRRRGIGGTRLPDRDVKDQHHRGSSRGNVSVDDHGPAIRG